MLSSSSIRLIVDLMGGDHAPQAQLEGVALALPQLEGELVLIGDEAIVSPLLQKRRFKMLRQALAEQKKVRLVHASETIAMGDSIRAIRSKPNASINIGCRMAAEDWKKRQVSAFLSAGHSGAVMASALVNMGRLSGLERPAIAVRLPSLSRDGVILIDSGANTECKPEHLRDFALMGALFSQASKTETGLPRVGVLSNGEERSKGTDLTRAAAELIEKHPCFQPSNPNALGKFIGYAEGKELYQGKFDVVVTDGFTGNLVLKTSESLASAIVQLLKREAMQSKLISMGFLLAKNAFKSLKTKIDYAEIGSAPLLGVAGYVFIAHGRSNARAVKNALLSCQSVLKSRYVERLEQALHE